MERFLKHFIPKNYQLNLTINKQAETIQGTVLIAGQALSAQIKLHAVAMQIDTLQLNQEPCDTYTHRNGVLSIKIKKPLPVVKITITFHKKLSHNMQGPYLSSYQHQGRTEKIVATQFESHYARECFPCLDEPAAKATFDLSITTDSSDTVLANTPVKQVMPVSSPTSTSVQPSRSTQLSTTSFTTTPKMSTYLLAFVIGKFHHKSSTNQHNVKITSYCALNQDPAVLDFANHIAAAALDYYDQQFGVPYPLPKLDQVALPDFEAGAMENWGLVTYRESCLLVDPKATLSTKAFVASVIAHELSHQWFGNLVTMQWWDELWLNESFANVIEYFAVDAIHPEYHIWEDFFTGDCLSALNRDALPGVQAVQQPVKTPAEIATLFDAAIVYAKGAHLMFMLIRLIGQKQFFAGIKTYFKQHQYSNTTGDDLWAALQPHADFDVKAFMQAWISQPGYPVFTGDKQQRFLLNSSSSHESKVTQATLTNQPEPITWPVPKLTDDMSGHYVINLPLTDFQAQLKKFGQLSLEQKLRLLIDRLLLAKTPAVSSASLLDLIPQLQYETNYSVWSLLISTINHLKLFCPPGSSAEQSYQAYLRQSLQPQLKRLGLTPQPQETTNDTKLRPLLLALAHYAQDLPTLEQLAQLYRPEFSQINSEIRSAVLRAQLFLEESHSFNILLEQYQQQTDPEIKTDLLIALSDARQAQQTQQLIALLEQPKIIRPQDHLRFYIYLRRNHHTAPQALDWLFTHWDYLVQMTGEKSLEDYPRYTAATIKTQSAATAFFKFFDPLVTNPVLTRSINVARAEVAARLALIAADRPAVHARLSCSLI